MKVYVGQLYIETNASYRFSHLFQQKMHEELTRYIPVSEKFISEYGEEFELMFNMSAKSHLSENEVRGPAVFPDAKDVEYTIFLPFDHSAPLDDVKRRFALEHLFSGIFEVLDRYEINFEEIKAEKDRIICEILSNPNMNKGKRWDED